MIIIVMKQKESKDILETALRKCMYLNRESEKDA